MSRGRIGQQVGILYAGTLASQGLTAVVYLISARSMGPGRFGDNAACSGVILIAVAAADFGGALLALRELSSKRMSRTQFGRWLRSKVLVLVVLTPFIAVLAGAVTQDLAPAGVLVAGLFFLSSSLSLAMATPLRANLRFLEVVTALIVSRALGTLLALTWKYVPVDDAYMLIFLLAVTSSVEALLYGTFDRWSFLRAGPGGGRRRLVNPYAGSAWIGASATVTSAGSLDIPAVRWTAGGTVAGEYAAVNRWMGPIGLMSQAVTQAIFPHLSSAAPSERAKLLRSGMLMISLSLPVLGAVALFAGPLVRLLLGSGYEQSIDTLRLLCLAISLALACQPLSAALVAWSNEKLATFVVGAGILIQLLSQGWLASRLGAPGAALGGVIGQAATLTFLAICIRRSRSMWMPRSEIPAPQARSSPSLLGG